MKVLHFEDSEVDAKVIELALKNEMPSTEYIHEDEPYCAWPITVIEKPDILICDYNFKYSTLERGLCDAIRKFKGGVYIFSGAPIHMINSTLEKCFNGCVPDNIKIYQKGNPRAMISDIVRGQAVTA